MNAAEIKITLNNFVMTLADICNSGFDLALNVLRVRISAGYMHGNIMSYESLAIHYCDNFCSIARAHTRSCGMIMRNTAIKATGFHHFLFQDPGGHMNVHATVITDPNARGGFIDMPKTGKFGH